MTASRIVPPSATRVECSTSAEVNARIHEETARRLEGLAGAGPAAPTQRLAELEREWDVERLLEMNASTLILLALLLGFTVNRKWFRLPVVVAAFLFQHALQGWCPPIPILRRYFGVRTEHEINAERSALRILRGDFRGETHDARAALALAEEP